MKRKRAVYVHEAEQVQSGLSFLVLHVPAGWLAGCVISGYQACLSSPYWYDLRWMCVRWCRDTDGDTYSTRNYPVQCKFHTKRTPQKVCSDGSIFVEGPCASSRAGPKSPQERPCAADTPRCGVPAEAGRRQRLYALAPRHPPQGLGRGSANFKLGPHRAAREGGRA
ncbi:hypothetical protein CALCODRAFT_180548 [Calocera cornea HHB12733]|uniref:Uncharacterized protein n=1 Tax=Calocera cornea HHB12733 TaxID=1353952 RepID=A0A165CC21_9BASI|nr:hypothetical protein CALCODRAFT_180548 [Calocera cornea HHB12733]